MGLGFQDAEVALLGTSELVMLAPASIQWRKRRPRYVPPAHGSQLAFRIIKSFLCLHECCSVNSRRT